MNQQRRRFGWSALALVFGLALATPQPADAQLTYAGQTLMGGGVDFTDVAFDETAGVYLQVFLAGGHVQGRFVGADGVELGQPFRVGRNAQAYSGWPHVAYSTGSTANVFLVVYSTDSGRFDVGRNIWGQYIRYAGGAPEFVGNPFPVSDAFATSGFLQNSGGLAFNPSTNQFLVTWDDNRFGWDVFGRIFNIDGTPATGEVNLTPGSIDKVTPNAAFDWNTRRFVVTWAGDAAPRVAGTFAQVYDEALNRVGGEMVLSSGPFQDMADVIYLPETGRFLTYWREEDRATSANVQGRLVTPDGALEGGITPLLVTPVFDGAPDADYNWVSRTVMLVAQHDSGFVWGIELNGAGQPQSGHFQASFVNRSASNTGSNFPQVITGPNGQFGLGFSANYNSTWFLRWQAGIAPTPGPRPGSGGGGTPSATIDLTAQGAPNGSWFLAEGAANRSVNGYQTYYLIANENQEPVTMRSYYAAENGHTIAKERVIAGNSRTTIKLQDEAGQGAFGSVFQSLTMGQGGAPLDVRVERSIFWGPNMEGSTGATAVKDPAFRWYFAEGSRGGERFANYFLLFNPTQAAGNVTATFYLADGTSVVYTPPNGIGAQQRLSIDASVIPELAGKDFSTVIDSTVPTVAERSMYWGWNGTALWTGGTASMGSTMLNTRWYFAEGAAASGYQTYYLLWNANDFDITVNGTFRTETGQTFTQPYTVGRKSRRTIELNTEFEKLVGNGNVGGVAAEFNSANGAFLAERSSYWGAGWVEGINVIGTPGVATEWSLPEGTTGGLFQTYLLLLNPNHVSVPVNISLFTEDGQRYTVVRTLPADSRTTINMHGFITDEVGEQSLLGKSFATRVQVHGGNPGIVAEHAIYWNAQAGNFWRGGSGTVGIARGFAVVP